ncbi:MAG TPA: aspartate/glutamate racemase family protein [Thermodesulfobacteriota bacterium]|nr:aspartate/glutamate racemase family protein [Thermodesulfobacteriota bacterium]
MYGWRARIGIIIPSVNTTFEPECHRLSPEGVSFHFSRMNLGDLTIEGLREMGKHTIEKGKELAAAGVDLIVFGCTSGSFSEGKGHDEKIIRELQEATGIPALATSTAVIKALKALSVQSFALCSPYSEELNTREKEFFEAQGFKVTAVAGLGLVKKTPLFPLASRPVSHVGLQEYYISYKLARMVNSPEAQAIFISCTNFRSLEVIEKLEIDLRKPVISSNQATVWAALQSLSIYETIPGAGSLFRYKTTQ